MKRLPLESEYHIVGVRFRIVGSGNFESNLSDLDSIQNQPLKNITMAVTTRFEPTLLSNFQSQRTRLECQTTEINEVFRISRIIIFAKPVATEYPM